jgi:hypothetical protein
MIGHSLATSKIRDRTKIHGHINQLRLLVVSIIR